MKTDKTRVSLFVDPDIKQIENIKSIGANRVELYTGPYASNPILEVLSSYETSYNYAKSIGLDVNAGHDLDLENLKPFLDRAPVDEVSIGHALISDALIYGLDTITKKYLDLCK